MTDLRDRFVEAYLKSRNATDAMRKAGFAPMAGNKQFDPYRLLRDPYIKQQIQAAHEAMAMEAREAVGNLGEVARGEWSAYLGPDGVVDLAQLTADGKAHLVKKVRTGPGFTEVEFPDRLRALEIILKMEGLLGTNISPEDLIAFMLRFGGSTSEIDRLKREATVTLPPADGVRPPETARAYDWAGDEDAE